MAVAVAVEGRMAILLDHREAAGSEAAGYSSESEAVRWSTAPLRQGQQGKNGRGEARAVHLPLGTPAGEAHSWLGRAWPHGLAEVLEQLERRGRRPALCAQVHNHMGR